MNKALNKYGKVDWMRTPLWRVMFFTQSAPDLGPVFGIRGQSKQLIEKRMKHYE